MLRLLRALLALRRRIVDLEVRTLRAHPHLHPPSRRSAANLIHYTALRARENRGLQVRLAKLGLSSLGRAEGNVLANLDAVVARVRASAGLAAREPGARPAIPPLGGSKILARNADALLGRGRPGRPERIMVTLPTEAADDPAFVRTLVAAGMDCARINCAHGDAEAWKRMIRNVRKAARAARCEVRVVMDLAGPKIRTGPVSPGPEVVRWRPRRDEFGRPVEPARVFLAPAGHRAAVPDRTDAVLPVAADWLARRRAGDVVTLVDARGSARTLRIAGAADRGRWAECTQTAYVVSGTRLECTTRRGPGGGADATTVGRLPPTDRPIVLRPGDEIVVTRSLEPGAAAQFDEEGRLLSPARIGCTLPDALRAARPGHACWFDDGKIGGTVVSADAGEARVRIGQAPPGGGRLRADKGINLPDSDIAVPALTEKDLADLRFVVEHADMVSLSFVRCRTDVEDLLGRLATLGRPDFGVVLKIETRAAFERLPEILLAAMRSPRPGVMIARGDLGVECGFERLAEAQEEILWFAEAAHLPVIWATQVLDGMARTGMPSRAEVTDASMGVRAECVMLNKGPHVAAAVAALDGILRRMEGHLRKKSPLLRRLRVATRFAESVAGAPASRELRAPRRRASHRPATVRA